MVSHIQSTISKIKHGQLTVGSWMQIGHPCIGKVLARCGFDWIAVDLEHGTYSQKDLPAIFDLIAANDCLALARLSENSEVAAKLALDAGAGGIIVPMVNNKEDAVAAVRAAKYPPEGKRGIGFSSTSNFGKDFASYFNNWNQEAVVIAQVEHIDSVNNLETIVNVEGIDGIIVGPYDLSGSMGITGEFESPEFTKIMGRIAEKVRSSGKLLGVHVVSPDTCEVIDKTKVGYNFIAYSIDAVVLWSHFSEAVTKIKTCVQQSREKI